MLPGSSFAVVVEAVHFGLESLEEQAERHHFVGAVIERLAAIAEYASVPTESIQADVVQEALRVGRAYSEHRHRAKLIIPIGLFNSPPYYTIVLLESSQQVVGDWQGCFQASLNFQCEEVIV